MRSWTWAKSFLLLFGVGVVGCASQPLLGDKSAGGGVKRKHWTQAISEVNPNLCKEKSLHGADQASDWKAQTELAAACVSQKNWRLVERAGQSLSRMDLQSPWGFYYRSLAAEGQGEMGRALWMIDLALVRATDVGLLYFQKGRLLYAQNQMSEAVALIERAATLDEGNFSAHLILGQLYLRNGEAPRAKVFLQQAARLQPRNLSAALGLAECWAAEKDYQAAANLLAPFTMNPLTDSRLSLRRADLLALTVSGKAEAVELYQALLTVKNTMDGQERQRIEGRIKMLSEELQKQSVPKEAKRSERDVAAQNKGGT